MLADNWCRFVLNEGIMPASLARYFKQSDATYANAKLLAQLLKTRENFHDSFYPEITELTKRAFLNDEELNNWLVSVDSILTIIITFANGDNNTQDVLNGAFTSFIKSCPLVAEGIKANYLTEKVQVKPTTNNPKIRYRNNSSSVRINEFIAYLVRVPYSTNTINSYCTSINISAELASKHELTSNLWDIEDAAEMQSIFDKLKSLADYRDRNIKTHNCLSSALQQYIKFLSFKSKMN